MKRTRQAKWRECAFCKIRGMDPPYRSGKLKCLLKHQVECEAAHRLEIEAQTRPKIDVLLAMMQRQTRDIAKLTSRVAILEERKRRKPEDRSWETITPKEAWANRKRLVMRFIRVILNEHYRGPCRWYKTRWECFRWLVPEDISLADILQMALWPVLDERDGTMCLRGVQTTDVYFLFKQLWGKKEPANLDFVLEAYHELGIPEEYYSAQSIRATSHEFQRIVEKYQTVTKRAGSQMCHGCFPLYRHWKQITMISEETYEAATALPLSETLHFTESIGPPQ